MGVSALEEAIATLGHDRSVDDHIVAALLVRPDVEILSEDALHGSRWVVTSETVVEEHVGSVALGGIFDIKGEGVQGHFDLFSPQQHVGSAVHPPKLHHVQDLWDFAG